MKRPTLFGTPEYGDEFEGHGEGMAHQSRNPLRIERVQLTADWYACDAGVGIRAFYDFTDGKCKSIVELDSYDAEDEGLAAYTLFLRDASGQINGDLLAKYGSDGRLYLPRGTMCIVYLPDDSVDGHWELLHAGTTCEEGSGSGSGSEGSDGSGSESGSGESGSGESGSGESGSGESGSGSGCTDYRLPPCPEDASLTNKYVLVCDGSGCPRWELTQPCNPSAGSSGGEL